MGTVVDLKLWKMEHILKEDKKEFKISFPIFIPSWPFGWLCPIALTVTVDLFNLQ